jgi:zinc and cadmium transporter
VLAITVHKFPAALALSSILIKGGAYSKQRVLAYMAIFALTTPLGALATIYIFKSLSPHFLGVAMGISAGTFLYIAIADLLPTVHEEHERKYKNLICFCLGIFSMMLFQGLI